MDDFLIEAEDKMGKAIETMERRFSNVRAGRANPAVLDGVMVNYYGTPTPLKSLATISIPEARQLMIKPFDKSSLSAIEKKEEVIEEATTKECPKCFSTINIKATKCPNCTSDI